MDSSIRELRAREDLMFQALSSFPQAVCILDHQQRLVFSNKKFNKIMDQDPLSKSIDEKGTVYNGIHEGISECARQVLLENSDIQKRVVVKEQTWTILAKILTLKDSSETYVMVILHPNESLMSEEDQHRKDFIQIAAHELRTPLTAIKGFIQLVLERYKERNRKWFFQPTSVIMSEINRDKTFFKVIFDEAIRLDQLTNELLSIFKIDQGKFQMNYQQANFSQVIKEAIEEFNIPTDFHHVHFINTEEELPVYIDVKQIKRVISNLLSNAIKYSPKSPDVFVNLRLDHDHIILSVRDEGIGIPEEQQNRIFERFFRAYSPEHEHIQGYGIGLHICQEIMNQHHGKLDFKSTFGKGSTFYVYLPINKDITRNYS